MADNTKQGAAYRESDDHVPSPYDMTGTFNTSGTGAHLDLSSVSPVVEVDKEQTAQAILDDDATVLYAENKVPEQSEQESALKEAAQERVDAGPVEVGGPTPAEAEAAEETDSEVRDDEPKAETKTATKTAAAKTTAAKPAAKN